MNRALAVPPAAARGDFGFKLFKARCIKNEKNLRRKCGILPLSDTSKDTFLLSSGGVKSRGRLGSPGPFHEFSPNITDLMKSNYSRGFPREDCARNTSYY